MKIAQVSPLYESVPPRMYGGTERIVSYLTEELVAMGHEVTLYASGDSVTKARLVPICRRSLRLDESCIDQLAHQTLMLEKIFRDIEQYDIIHFHIDYAHFPLSRRANRPRLTTLHGRLDIPDLVPLYEEYRDEPLISISNTQRRPLPWVRWVGTVHHGLPPDLLHFHPKPQNYLAFIGRISPEKRLDRAIEIAERAGMELRIAAKVAKSDQEYFETTIKPLLSKPHVNYLGEIDEPKKDELVGNALAFLFPIDWPEPFGLVMIESFAVGTPVIAWRNGSVPEIIDENATGFIVESIEDAVAAVEKARSLNRAKVRRKFEERFMARRMAEDYVAIYEKFIHPSRPARRAEEAEEYVVF